MTLLINWATSIVTWFFEKICKWDTEDKRLQTLIQFVRFGVVGVSNTVISYVLYLVSLKGLQACRVSERIDYLIAQVIAWILSVAWSFYWNNKCVFTGSADADAGAGTKEFHLWQALLKTYLSYAFTGLFLNSVLSILWVEIIGLSKLIAPIINLLVSVPVNFLMNKFWAFRNK